MSLSDVQTLLAEIFTNSHTLEAFLEDRRTVMSQSDLSEDEKKDFEEIPEKNLRNYWERLQGKRLLEVEHFFHATKRLMPDLLAMMIGRFKQEHIGTHDIASFADFVLENIDDFFTSRKEVYQEICRYDAQRTLILKGRESLIISEYNYPVQKIIRETQYVEENITYHPLLVPSERMALHLKAVTKNGEIQIEEEQVPVPQSAHLSMHELFVSTQLNTNNYQMMLAIQDSLQTSGFYKSDSIFTLDDFYNIADIFGVVTDYQDIFINPNIELRFLLPDKLAFHSDRYDTDIVAWFCDKQDPVLGHSVLLDLGDIDQYYTSSELVELNKVLIVYYYKNMYFGIPPVKPSPNGYKVYYHPWSDVVFPNPEVHRPLWERFLAMIEYKENNEMIRFRLEEGQVLFIDNRRLLHGRESIAEDSPRLLKRVWVKTNNEPWITKQWYR